MKTKTLDTEGLRRYVLVLDTGDEAMSALAGFAGREAVSAASFTAIGAFSESTVGFFDWELKDYLKIRVDEQVEVLVLAGGIAMEDGKPKVHAHVVLGKRDGATVGGHLMDGRVRPTLEVVITESRDALQRRHDPESGLALIDLDGSR